MDAEHLIETLIRGALGSRPKRSRGALRFLTGGRHSLLNAGTLLTAAGVAWGLYETMTQQGSTASAAGGSGQAGPPPVTRGAHLQADQQQRDLPAEAGSHGDAGSQTAAGSHAVADPVTPEVLRVIRLTIAAARADGRLAEQERAAILEQARAVGAEALVQQEIDRPRPLAEIVAGAADPNTREQLYVLAFAVVRADESVSGAERIFLAQLAHALGLDPAATTRLESEAASRIDDGRRPGGIGHGEAVVHGGGRPPGGPGQRGRDPPEPRQRHDRRQHPALRGRAGQLDAAAGGAGVRCGDERPDGGAAARTRPPRARDRLEDLRRGPAVRRDRARPRRERRGRGRLDDVHDERHRHGDGVRRRQRPAAGRDHGRAARSRQAAAHG